MARGSRKDRAFFDAFGAHAEKSLEAARLFVELLACLPSREATRAYRPNEDEPDVDPRVETLAAAIKEAERAADRITHDTMKRLHENWITPLDRDDIHRLASRTDDVLDEIEAAADRFVLFDVRFAVPEVRALADVLVASCAALAKAIDLLRDMSHAKEILRLCVEVNRLENEADRIHRTALKHLFRAGNDPLTVMKWREIFESLESAADRCEDVANVLESVVLEYA